MSHLSLADMPLMFKLAIVCQINILVGVQALAWFCQTKVWTPFSESL
jgi:hypothetical protein